MRDDTTTNIEWVDQLLLNNPRRWNTELIERLFNTHEATVIQQIPLLQGDR